MRHSLVVTFLFAFAAALPLLGGCKEELRPVCGNGVIEGTEECDGADFQEGDSCQKRGYLGGALFCSPAACVVEEKGCIGGCGNGLVEGDEECDKTNFLGKNCRLYDYDYGSLTCRPDCTVDTSSCRNAVCGNGVIEEPRIPVEECEPGLPLERDCGDFGFNEGEVVCAPPGSENECRFDISGCRRWECGNGVLDPPEDCEWDAERNPLLFGETCETQGFDYGTLACIPPDPENRLRACRFDVSGCGSWECGNGEVEGDEECEEGVPITDTCQEHGFEGGTMACDTASCRFNFSGCTNGCGNGRKEGTEECDGEDVGGQNCATITGGAYQGPLGCKLDCTYDLSSCTPAG